MMVHPNVIYPYTAVRNLKQDPIESPFTPRFFEDAIAIAHYILTSKTECLFMRIMDLIIEKVVLIWVLLNFLKYFYDKNITSNELK